MASNGPIKVLSAIGSLTGVAAATPVILDSVSHVEQRGIEGESVTWKFERVTNNENGDYPIKLGDKYGRFGFCWNKKGEKKCNSNFFWGKRTKESGKKIDEPMGGSFDIMLMFGSEIKDMKWGDFVLSWSGEDGYNGLWRKKVKLAVGGNGTEDFKDVKGNHKNSVGDIDKKKYSELTGHWCLIGEKGWDKVKNKGLKGGEYGFTDLYWEKGWGWICGTKGVGEVYAGKSGMSGFGGSSGVRVRPKGVHVRDYYLQTTGGGNKATDKECLWQTNGASNEEKSFFDNSDRKTYGFCITGIDQWTWVQDS